jgi:HEAT repeat protein
VSYLFPTQTITLDAALRDLTSGSRRARVDAAHALGDVLDPAGRARAVAALLAGLDDDEPQVRAEVCASLGALAEAAAADGAVVAGLIRRLDDGVAPVRQAACIALGTLRAGAAFPALVAALGEGGADLRFQAATSLAEIDPIAAYQPLVGALPDRDDQVTSAIALALGGIGDGRAAGHLAPLLEHAAAAVRFDAAYALAQLGDGRGRAELARAARTAERGWDAVGALAQLAAADGGAADAEALAAALRGDAPEACTRAAGTLLRLPAAAAHHDAARALLRAGLGARKQHLRGLAVEELVRAEARWAVPELEALARTRRGRELGEALTEAVATLRAPGPASGARS